MIFFSFPAIGRINEGCLITYPKSYQMMSLQCRQPNVSGWIQVTSTKTTDNGNTITIECNHLPVGSYFEFRGLFEKDNDIKMLTSKEKIQIISMIA